MKRPSLSQSLSIAAFLALSGMCLYLFLQLKHVNRDLDAAAGQDMVQAITKRLDGVEDRLDHFAGSKPVQDADFRASQQALSQRIDTTQALMVEIQRANQSALQGVAQAADLVALEAKIEGLQNDLSDLRKKASEPAKAPPPLIVPKQRSTPVATRKHEPPKPIETPPPFTVVGIEYRGGERFLSVAPPGSTQLSELYLVRPGDNVGGTRWRLASLDDRQAQFSVDGATRILSLK
ncbi:hypothetical protein [Pseudomonas oryzihabitans]|uniref:hypothetical protein n=1 Tax=Pseudomonas oryzihabitans TaxID=47885 RepID=UPI00285EF982|nr:hypothetical protein [Pseudomonas psychrotolerans]MDR6680186.1 hypothetical protein [Pseudomonas psychrotolerans]